MKLVLEWEKSLRENRAAVRIQANYRRHRQRNVFVNEIYRRYVAQTTRPALTIQTAWRRYRAMGTAKLDALSRLVHDTCRAKARIIVANYKSNSEV